MTKGYIVRIKFEYYKDYEIIGETLEDSIKIAEERFLSEQRNDFNNAKYAGIADISFIKIDNSKIRGRLGEIKDERK